MIKGKCYLYSVFSDLLRLNGIAEVISRTVQNGAGDAPVITLFPCQSYPCVIYQRRRCDLSYSCLYLRILVCNVWKYSRQLFLLLIHDINIASGDSHVKFNKIVYINLTIYRYIYIYISLRYPPWVPAKCYKYPSCGPFKFKCCFHNRTEVYAFILSLILASTYTWGIFVIAIN